jgi:hypothetical protein
LRGDRPQRCRRRKDTEGDFARKIIGSGGTLQGLHVINTAGDLIGYVYDFRPESVLAILEKALKKFEPIEAPAIAFVETKDGKMTRFDLVANGQFWGHGAYTPGAPAGKFPLAIAFTLADVNDPLSKLVPDAVRCYSDYLR